MAQDLPEQPVSPPPLLHVCITCRAGLPLADGAVPPGQHLFDAVSAALAASAAPPLRLAAVKCLAICDTGCAAAISTTGKWSYLLGRLERAHATDLLTYAVAYAASASGAVLPSRRPASLGRAVLGRLPAPELAPDLTPDFTPGLAA